MKTLTWFIWNTNNPTTPYTYCESVNECPAAVARANAYRQDNIESYTGHVANYPDNAEYWQDCLNKNLSAKYICGTWENFQAAQKDQLIGEVHEITEEEWYEALEVLPPVGWADYPHGYNMFFCAEAYTGTYASQYARRGGKYYSAMADKADKSTWINERLTHVKAA